jgi:hypothetical protein
MARDAARWSVLLGRLALIALALIAPYTAALSRNDLYHYTGPGASALESDPNGMLMSAEVALKTPIAFYDRIYNSIFVSTDRKRRGQMMSQILGYSPEVHRRYNRMVEVIVTSINLAIVKRAFIFVNFSSIEWH